MAEYTVKFKYSTARAGRGKGEVVGGGGQGELDITVDGPFNKKDTKNPELVEGCKNHIKNEHRIKDAIISFEITEIVDK